MPSCPFNSHSVWAISTFPHTHIKLAARLILFPSYSRGPALSNVRRERYRAFRRVWRYDIYSARGVQIRVLFGIRMQPSFLSLGNFITSIRNITVEEERVRRVRAVGALLYCYIYAGKTKNARFNRCTVYTNTHVCVILAHIIYMSPKRTQ